jgi:hypothetical protein
MANEKVIKNDKSAPAAESGFKIEYPEFNDVSKSAFAIPKAIADQLVKDGYVGRFISAQDYLDRRGSHPQGWKVFRLQLGDKASRASLDFSLGLDPEGYIRYKEMVLAIRPKSLNDAHKAEIRERTERQSGVAKRAAEEIKYFAKDRGLKDLRMFEGYEENT